MDVKLLFLISLLGLIVSLHIGFNLLRNDKIEKRIEKLEMK